MIPPPMMKSQRMERKGIGWISRVFKQATINERQRHLCFGTQFTSVKGERIVLTVGMFRENS